MMEIARALAPEILFQRLESPAFPDDIRDRSWSGENPACTSFGPGRFGFVSVHPFQRRTKDPARISRVVNITAYELLLEGIELNRPKHNLHRKIENYLFGKPN